MKMKLIIYDGQEEGILERRSDPTEERIIIADDGSIRNCIGCFGCWIKTPGACIIPDKYDNMGELFSKCEELLIVSQCFYGGFSPFVKNVLDRSISYIHPDFVMRNGEMHHKRRYSNRISISVWFYGEHITEQEKQTAKKLVEANRFNFDATINKVSFVRDVSQVGGL